MLKNVEGVEWGWGLILIFYRESFGSPEKKVYNILVALWILYYVERVFSGMFADMLLNTFWGV